MSKQILKAIKKHHLHYTNENELCIQRKSKGKKFVYQSDEGKQVKNKKLIERIESLVIPPAWEEVLICKKTNGHIQATGRDSKGRKQYIYHVKWSELSNESKFNKMIEFGKALPTIRKQIEKDLKQKLLQRRKVLALVIKLMEETLIRIGNEIYAEQNKSFGLTTLKNKHIKVKGSTIKFHFNGKSGKTWESDFNDKSLAKILKKCQELPGQQLFQYIDEDGKRNPIESSDVNEYLNEIVTKDFTAKDFRTWGATIFAAEKLSEISLAESEKQNNKNIVAVIKETANHLNNTPAICKKYYIHPKIIEAYLDGYLLKVMSDIRAKRKTKYGLNKFEKVVIKILKKY